mgnify:CR=1 FL=1
MAGAFECNEYQDVYLTPVDLEESSLGNVLRPGETEVSGLMMMAWAEVEAALLRQDVVGYVSVPVSATWCVGTELCDVQAYTPHAAEYIAALSDILRELPLDLLSSEGFKCGAWARPSIVP